MTSRYSLLPSLVLCASAFWGVTVDAQERAKPLPAVDTNRSGEEKAILAADEAFVVDYNKGDSKALAARYAEDAEVIEADGTRYEGRDAIEKSLAANFAASPGLRMTMEIESIRFITADVAKEEGLTIVNPTKGAPSVCRYTVIYAKRDGKWLMTSVREEHEPAVRPGDRLKDLDWMIGEWIDEDAESVVRADCRRSEDGNFLIRRFAIKLEGKPALTVSQRIAWDPSTRRFRSWEFDSDGGFGEGTWSRNGDRWVVKHLSILADGSTASATQIMTILQPNMVRWVAVDRVVGAESLPDGDAYVFVRVPPKPSDTPKKDATTPTPPASPTRNPR